MNYETDMEKYIRDTTKLKISCAGLFILTVITAIFVAVLIVKGLI